MLSEKGMTKMRQHLLSIGSVLVLLACAENSYATCILPAKAESASNNFLFYGTKDLNSFGDFNDLVGFESDREAINWYLHSGITNGGQDWDHFGPSDIIPRWELAQNLHRFYSIMNESGAPFADVPVLMGTGMDTALERKFFAAVIGLRGAGIIGTHDAQGNYRPDDPLSVHEMLVTVYRAVNNPDASRVPGTFMEPGTADDLKPFKVSGELGDGNDVASIAGMLRAQCYLPVNKQLDLDAGVKRIDMVRVLYALRGTPAPKRVNNYADARLKADITADGQSLRIRGLNWNSEQDNPLAVQARNGGQVMLDDSRISASGTIKAPDQFGYRWGMGGVLLANGYGSSIDIDRATLKATGRAVYSLYSTAGGSITIRNSEIDGGRTGMVTYNGRLTYDNVRIRGNDRTFSSDHFGGIVIYRNVDSNKAGTGNAAAPGLGGPAPGAGAPPSGQGGAGGPPMGGGGGFFLDENTTGEFYNSTLVGDSLGTITGIGRAYFKDTVVTMRSGLTLVNNTSLLTDVATATLQGGSFTMTQGDLFTIDKKQQAMIFIDGSKISIPSGRNLVSAVKGGKARVYLKNVTIKGNVTAAAGSSVEVFLDNAKLIGKTSGTVSISQGVRDAPMAK